MEKSHKKMDEAQEVMGRMTYAHACTLYGLPNNPGDYDKWKKRMGNIPARTPHTHCPTCGQEVDSDFFDEEED